MSRFEGNLPDGRYTKSAKVYAAAWHEFARPIAEATGLRPYGYEPGVLYVKEGVSLSLPTWFIKKINEALLKEEAV